MKHYYKTDVKGAFIKITVGYELGGYNYYNGKKDGRGYYLYVQPVEREDDNGYKSESFIMFEGFKQLLVSVLKKNKKAEAEAIRIALTLSQDLANKMAVTKGYVLTGEVEEVL